MIGKLIDNLIAPISPALALKRLRHRQAYEALSNFKGAQKDRMNRSWKSGTMTADGALLPDVTTLRNRSRQLARDNADVASIFGAFSRNVVGCGIEPEPAAVNRSGKLRTSLNKASKVAFWDWATDPAACDIERRQTFWEMQAMCIEQQKEAGEILVNMAYREHRTDVGLVLQLLESEQLDTITNFYEPTGNEVRGGVEIDNHGAAVAYHFFEVPEGDYTNSRFYHSTFDSHRVPADRILHLQRPKRPRQTRGIPALSPVMNKLNQLDEYDAATLQAAWIEACIALIINREPSTNNINTLQTPTGADATDVNSNTFADFQSAMIFEGEDGETVSGLQPQRPGNMYKPFVELQKRAAAAGVGIDYETMARDFTGGTYSSLRQALLESRREYECNQQWLINHMCRPIWTEFIRIAVAERKLPGVDMFQFAQDPKRYTYATWHAPKWAWIDPLKEVSAVEKALEIKLTSHAREIAKTGADRDEIFAEIEADQMAAEERGFSLNAPAPAAPAQPDEEEAADAA